MDFEVVGTLMYNGLSGFALKFEFLKKKQKKDRLVE